MPTIPVFMLPLLAPALALAQPAAKVEISPGETLTLRVAGDGAATVDGRAAAAPLNDLETDFMGRARRVAIVPGVKSQPPFPGMSATSPPPVAPGLLRITFRLVPPPVAKGANGDMLLSIENGYDGALRYKAVMRRGNGAKPTDVCIVMPLKRGYEQWPFPFDRIELSDFRLIPWHQGDGISCE
jgi:hypothetical protein